MDSFVVLASSAMTSSNDSKPSEAPVDHSSAQCCHCGYRNSHAPDCPFNSKTKCTSFMPLQVKKNNTMLHIEEVTPDAQWITPLSTHTIQYNSTSPDFTHPHILNPVSYNCLPCVFDLLSLFSSFIYVTPPASSVYLFITSAVYLDPISSRCCVL